MCVNREMESVPDGPTNDDEVNEAIGEEEEPFDDDTDRPFPDDEEEEPEPEEEEDKAQTSLASFCVIK